MTQVFITIDTELSAGLFQRGASADANYAASIEGRTASGSFGIGWQMDRLEAHGLTGVFFVDPMPALVYGGSTIAQIVTPIVARRHAVELHLHPEWLVWATKQPVGNRRGRSIGDFDYDDQVTLMTLARTLLTTAGAPTIQTFRAGNFGANDDTLRAAAAIGLMYDSSFNPVMLGSGCRIGLASDQIDPIVYQGVTEIPVSAIEDRPGHIRPAQLCALSACELREALYHAAATARPTFTVVTHSFEMLSRDRKRPNRLVMARFEAMCRTIASHPGLTTATFATINPLPETTIPARLPASYARTAWRTVEQAYATIAYER